MVILVIFLMCKNCKDPGFSIVTTKNKKERKTRTEYFQLCASLCSPICQTFDETDKFYFVCELHVLNGQHYPSVDYSPVHTDPVCERCSSVCNLHGGVLIVDPHLLPSLCYLEARVQIHESYILLVLLIPVYVCIRNSHRTTVSSCPQRLQMI